MSEARSQIGKLSDRSRAIMRHIVESYLATGEPVGSRNLSRVLPMTLSPASIRNVMSDLEHLGLIFSPHTSAGRIPTQTGLRMFVDGLLEVGDLTADERRQIEAQIAAGQATSIDTVLAEASNMISGLSHCAGLVLAEKQVSRLKHIEFVPLEPEKALVILVGDDQSIENRVVAIPSGTTPSSLQEAANFLNAHIRGLTIREAHERIEQQLKLARDELDALTQKAIKAGLAEWSGALDDRRSLIVRGQSNLLKDVSAASDLDRIRQLFDDLESKREMVQLLKLADHAQGVRIFIGSEDTVVSLSGASLGVAPFHDSKRKVVGVLGIIGPTRINYARIIPMVDYTARLVGRVLTR